MAIRFLMWSISLAWSMYNALASTPYNYTIRIDCGGTSDFINEFNQTWIADNFFTGGLAATVPGSFSFLQERTLRSFPISGGKKNCYIVDLPSGTYYMRMFFVYNNYDNKSHPPSFDVSVEGTVVFSWGPESWTQENMRIGAYSDLFISIEDGDATVCFYSKRTDTPVIGSLEIVQVDPKCYNGILSQNVLLVNYGRFGGGSESFGPGLSNDTDVAGRAWDVDIDVTHSSAEKLVLSTNRTIKNASQPPNYFPNRLYQMAHTVTLPEPFEYLLSVDPQLDYMLWFHFAEIDADITGANERVFDVYINDETAFRDIDIFREVGSFAAYDLVFTVRNLTNSTLNVKLVPKLGVPLISGIEIYALLPNDVSTDPNDVIAMRALKLSLQIPERMGWNGDPCAPSSWDAWEGVMCNIGADSKQLVITHLDLSNQGLQGFIGPEITSLRKLLTLNLSNNVLKGSIPKGLGASPLTSLDLSFNKLSGDISLTLGSGSLRTIFLNDNQLEGKVPEELYSIGVTGGNVNLTANQALCGVPSLPDCSVLWRSSHLSNRAKIGIVLSAIAVFVGCLATYWIIRKRKNDDYNFGFPRQLASRHIRYQKAQLWFGDETQLFQAAAKKFGFSSSS